MINDLLTSSRLLNDKQILNLCKTKQMITPFETGKIRESEGIKRISYGLSSFGYDIRLSDKKGDFKVFKFSPGTMLTMYEREGKLIDPKKFNEDFLLDYDYEEDETGKYVILPPHSYALGVSKEYFRIPSNIFGIVLTKSTLARVGCLVNCTPVEPGWNGNLVVEIANLTSLAMKVYLNEGIAQMYFFESEEDGTPYTGHYQDQKGLTLAKV